MKTTIYENNILITLKKNYKNVIKIRGQAWLIFFFYFRLVYLLIIINVFSSLESD